MMVSVIMTEDSICPFSPGRSWECSAILKNPGVPATLSCLQSSPWLSQARNNLLPFIGGIL